jgi:hypothetical protein
MWCEWDWTQFIQMDRQNAVLVNWKEARERRPQSSSSPIKGDDEMPSPNEIRQQITSEIVEALPTAISRRGEGRGATTPTHQGFTRL